MAGVTQARPFATRADTIVLRVVLRTGRIRQRAGRRMLWASSGRARATAARRSMSGNCPRVAIAVLSGNWGRSHDCSPEQTCAALRHMPLACSRGRGGHSCNVSAESCVGTISHATHRGRWLSSASTRASALWHGWSCGSLELAFRVASQQQHENSCRAGKGGGEHTWCQGSRRCPGGSRRCLRGGATWPSFLG